MRIPLSAFRRMRRWLYPLALCLSFMLLSMPVAAAAQTDVPVVQAQAPVAHLEISSAAVKAGEPFLLDVALSSSVPVLSGQMTIRFDPARISISGVDAAGESPVVNLREAATGTIRLAWASAVSRAETLVLFRLRGVGVAAVGDGTAALTMERVELFDAQAARVPASATAGTVRVSVTQPGGSVPPSATTPAPPAPVVSGIPATASGDAGLLPVPGAATQAGQGAGATTSGALVAIGDISASTAPRSVAVPVLLSEAGAEATAILDGDAYRSALLGAGWSVAKQPVLSFTLQEMESATAYRPSFPVDWVNQETPDLLMRIGTPFATVQIPGNFLSTGTGTGDAANTAERESASLSISVRSSSELQPAVSSLIGDRPVLELHLMRNGETVPWSNPGAPVSISIPYVPNAGEADHPERIVIWYLDGAGRATLVPSGRYDADSGMVSFQTTHFSTYAVGYQADAAGYADMNDSWARQPVEGLKLRGRLAWVTGNRFEPNRSLTRGQFVSLLLAALGLDAGGNAVPVPGATAAAASGGSVTKGGQRFVDVPSGRSDAAAIERAASLGIVLGAEGNRFLPDASISRQDMAVICARAMRCTTAVLKQTNERTLTPFHDQAAIASYARDGMALLVANGILIGSEGQVTPKGAVTRAQGAMIAWRLLLMQ